MPHYKISYFPLRFAGEVARQILAYAGQDFEDDRIANHNWPAIKPKVPFGTLPVLYVDGKPLGQSHAIARYLAREFGINGKTAWEEAQVNSIADQFKDYFSEIKEYNMVKMGFAEGDADKLYKEVFLPSFKKNYQLFTKFLKSSGSGFLVGDSLTWVDLLVAQHTADLLPASGSVFVAKGLILNEFPELRAHQQKIHAIPNIEKWLKTRPITPF
uniref:glutathione transferase n=1 Tax=Caenorhabditis japonica TaxID=281687 RepID=A0A8R1IXB1_CAEJA